MFDLGWAELAVVALVALIVVGPKELPQVLRTVAHWVRKARGLAREFQSSVDDMVREAELDEAKKAVQSARNLDFGKEIEDAVDPTGSLKEEISDVESSVRTSGALDDDVPPEFRDIEDAPEPKKASGKPGSGKSAASTGKSSGSNGAKIVEQPAQPAPPHSIMPPQETRAGDAGETTLEPQKSKSA